MIRKKEVKPLDQQEFDKWLETFFLDPLTSYLDETAFRIDVFETAEEFIVEALLTDYNENEISIFLEEDNINIKAYCSQKGQKQRVINFPFLIINYEVTAHFESGILEIYISKNIIRKGTNRELSI